MVQSNLPRLDLSDYPTSAADQVIFGIAAKRKMNAPTARFGLFPLYMKVLYKDSPPDRKPKSDVENIPTHHQPADNPSERSHQPQ
jgi:hypothetical protein